MSLRTGRIYGNKGSYPGSNLIKEIRSQILIYTCTTRLGIQLGKRGSRLVVNPYSTKEVSTVNSMWKHLKWFWNCDIGYSTMTQQWEDQIKRVFVHEGIELRKVFTIKKLTTGVRINPQEIRKHCELCLQWNSFFLIPHVVIN